MLQCPAGELATRVEKRTAENGNTYLRYVFSKVKCRRCPLRENCRVGKSKAKVRSYSITQASHKNQERLEFEASEMFKERLKIRHRIEEKNGELKQAYGLRRADSRGLFAMRLQMYFTAFTANVKRIVKIKQERQNVSIKKLLLKKWEFFSALVKSRGYGICKMPIKIV